MELMGAPTSQLFVKIEFRSAFKSRNANVLHFVWSESMGKLYHSLFTGAPTRRNEKN